MGIVINFQEERVKRDGLVDCFSCHNSIVGLTKEGIEDYHPKIDGLPVHFSCYQDNLVDTSKFAEVLNRNRYKK